MNIAERIKTIRKSASLGQQEFAKRLGTSQSTVSAFEKGDRKPDVEMAIHICDIFNANIQWLLLGSGPMYVDEKESRTGDMSPASPTRLSTQPVENITSEKNKTGDMSQGTIPLYQRVVELQDRLLVVTEQNADLRIQLGERDSRIRELTKENKALKEALKGTSGVPDNSEWAAS